MVGPERGGRGEERKGSCFAKKLRYQGNRKPVSAGSKKDMKHATNPTSRGKLMLLTFWLGEASKTGNPTDGAKNDNEMIDSRVFFNTTKSIQAITATWHKQCSTHV